LTTNAVQTTSTKPIESTSQPSTIPASANVPESSTQMKTSEQVTKKKVTYAYKLSIIIICYLLVIKVTTKSKACD
jgi:hypothetical protein